MKPQEAREKLNGLFRQLRGIFPDVVHLDEILHTVEADLAERERRLADAKTDLAAKLN